MRKAIIVLSLAWWFVGAWDNRPLVFGPFNDWKSCETRKAEFLTRGEWRNLGRLLIDCWEGEWKKS